MAMNRSQFRKELQEGLNAVFGLSYREQPDEYTEIFTTSTSNKAYEEDVLLVGLGAAQVKGEGAGVAYDAGGEAWAVRYHHLTIALAFSITQEAEEDGLYGKLGEKYAKALATSMRHTKEIFGANILNNGFDSNYAGGDGKALLATDHPLWGGGTFANKLATDADLSETSLEEALIGIDGFVDDRGIPKKVMVKKLIIPRQLRYTAERILASTQRVQTSDNDINAIKNTGVLKGGYAVNHYLTDSDAWYLTTDCPDGLKHMQRIAMQKGVEGDFETGNMRYKARERYSFGWTDPRGVYGSQGA